jgi:curved DNA-binding protein CbpA
MKHFINCNTIEELKQQYRKLAKLHHPDNGGNAETMKRINAEYDELFKILQRQYNANAKADKQNTERPEEFRELIEKLIKLDGVIIEICGSWVWLSGNTYKHRDIIKELGFLWSKGKKMWYLGEFSNKKRGSMPMEQIRNRYGSKKYKGEGETVLRLAM